MAKINISFDNVDYTIDEESFSAAAAELKSHLSSVMNGSGAVIGLDGISYNVDSVKLSNATTEFVAHLGTISGSGSKVVVGNVEYGISSAKIQDAINDLHSTFDELKVKEEPVTFATASWEKIAEISESGRASEHFAIGDEKVINLTIDGAEYPFIVKIIGFNHDYMSDGSGKAGITLMFFTTPNKYFVYTSRMTDQLAPYMSGYESSTNLYKEINNVFSTYLPSDLTSVIKSVTKKCNRYNSSSLYTINAKLWPPSSSEISGVYNTTWQENTGDRYTAFNDVITPIVSTPDGVAVDVWLRDWTKNNTIRTCYLNRSGTTLYQNYNYNGYMSICFCI